MVFSLSWFVPSSRLCFFVGLDELVVCAVGREASLGNEIPTAFARTAARTRRATAPRSVATITSTADIIPELFLGHPFSVCTLAGGREGGCWAGDGPTKTIPFIMDRRHFSCSFGFTLSTMFSVPAVVDTAPVHRVNVSLHVRANCGCGERLPSITPLRRYRLSPAPPFEPSADTLIKCLHET